MNRRIFLIALTCSIFLQAFSQSDDRKERIKASYLIAFGQLPQPGELNYWMTDALSLKTVNDLVEKHRQNTKNDIQLKYLMINNSYFDAFGRTPRPDEVAVWKGGSENYTELLSKHMNWINAHPADFEYAIRMSYLREWNREPTQQEIKDWKGWGVRPYYQICIEHKKNYKAAELAHSKTPKTDPKPAATLPLNSTIAQEVKSIPVASVIATGGGNVIATGGGNVIATGGGN